MALQLHHTQIILTEEVAVAPVMAVLKEQAELEMKVVILHQKETMADLPHLLMAEAAEELLVMELAEIPQSEDQEEDQVLLQLLDHRFQKLEAAEEQVF